MDSTPYQNNATIDHETMDIIIIREEHHQLLDNAVNGNIEIFKQTAEQLNLIVTPIKNTVLHINIASKKVSKVFVEEILRICPSLLVQVNVQRDTPLHVAAKFECIDVVTALIRKAKDQREDLESGIRADHRKMLRMINNKGNTALHEAMRSKCIGVVKILIEEDSGFSYSANGCGETPLYLAADNGFLEGVEEMLEKCTSVSYDGPNRKTALHAAVRRSNNQVVTRKICENNKSLTKKIDDNGWTPLHCAAYYGTFEAVQVLLEFDKSPAYVRDKYRKMTPLHLAAGRGHTNIINEIILRCPDCYELVDDKGWNVLHFAMATLNRDKLLILVENPLIKKLIQEKDVKGNTPFHVLATVTPYFYFTFFYRIINKVKGDIKAVNKKNVSVLNVFMMIGYPELQQEISELSKETGDGSYPLGVTGRESFRIEKLGLELLEKAKDSHIVAAALIATVTFAAAFTLPGGFKNEGKNQGMAILSRNSAFQTFVISDAIAMVFSMFAVCSYFIMALEVLPRQKYFTLFATAPWFVVIAMAAMVIAFVTGSYAVLSPSLGLAIATCFIGLTVFLLLAYVGYIFFKET